MRSSTTCSRAGRFLRAPSSKGRGLLFGWRDDAGMKRRGRLLLWFCLVVAPGLSGQEAAHDWLIVPGVRIGPVRASTSERSLVALLGAAKVSRRDAYVGEGICAPGSVLYAGTPDELVVAWADSTFSVPATVEVGRAGGQWHTPMGVRIGLPLAALEQFAGKPQEFSGLGWDYGGRGTWVEEPGEIDFEIEPDSLLAARMFADPRQAEILGERMVRSDHPLIQALKPAIDHLWLHFHKRSVEYECDHG